MAPNAKIQTDHTARKKRNVHTKTFLENVWFETRAPAQVPCKMYSMQSFVTQKLQPRGANGVHVVKTEREVTLELNIFL